MKIRNGWYEPEPGDGRILVHIRYVINGLPDALSVLGHGADTGWTCVPDNRIQNGALVILEPAHQNGYPSWKVVEENKTGE